MSTRKHVCVLNCSYEKSSSALKGVDDFHRTPAHYIQDGKSMTFETQMISKSTSYFTIRSLVQSKKYDCFFNLCDGGKDDDTAGEDVVRALEELNVPFTGADLEHYDPSKPDMKMLAYYSGIRCPMHFVCNSVPSLEELTTKCSKLKFPLLIKHPSGAASMGMTRDSKCSNVADLHTQIKIFVDKYHTCLVEEFIVGDEVTVLAVETPSGTKVLPPVRMNFPEGEEFKHFDLKWKDYGHMEWVAVPDTDPAYAEIQRVGKAAFESILGGIGYGRSDLRICRKTNQVYFLEINPNCGVLYPPGSEGSADWILKLDKSFGHTEFITGQIESAITRHKKKQPLHEVRFDPDKGYHMVARSAIPKGTVIFADEGRSFPLVTKPHVMANWSVEDKETFSRYAWPISADGHTYVTWEKDHKKWRPLNHSCNPNVVFGVPHSLNCVAARDIQADEELSMDYATFCDGTMKPFECCCGASTCRKLIVVTAEVLAQYGPHAWHRSVPQGV